VELPEPVPGPGQVRIRVAVCGVCHTDLHEIEGELPLPRLPLIPGHQVVGRVDRVGEGVRTPVVGDRVGVAWLHQTCGGCRFCATGSENLCREARFTGFHEQGGYAEAVLAPADFVYPIPGGFPDLQAAPLLCAGIIGYRALGCCGIRPGQRLGLYGFGASAHVAIQVARHRGCEVYVFTRSEGHRRLARRLGAAWVGGAEDDPPGRIDAAINFSPAGALVADALRIMERGGTVALAGIYVDQLPPLDYEAHLYYERSVTSVTASTRQDGHELLALASEIPIRTEVSVYPLDRVNDALRDVKHSRVDGAAVVRVTG
jgi:alcohol dehydrogenase, propanol-preferring